MNEETRELTDEEIETIIAAMPAEEREELAALAVDYGRRRHAMIRRVWRERARRYRPSLETCAVISAASVVIIVWAWM